MGIFSPIYADNDFPAFCRPGIWYAFDNPIKINIEISECKLFLGNSHSQNGSVGFYIKSCLAPVHRTDLSIDSNDFETVWVEVENKHGKNYLCCCVYLHANSNLDNFSNYLEVLSKQAVLDKQLFILGDFNSDLFNHNSHTPTANFANLFYLNNFFHKFFIYLEYLRTLLLC